MSAKSETGEPSKAPPDQESVRKLAYFNWVQAGQPENRDLEFWLEAERACNGRGSGDMGNSAGSSPASARPAATRDRKSNGKDRRK